MQGFRILEGPLSGVDDLLPVGMLFPLSGFFCLLHGCSALPTLYRRLSLECSYSGIGEFLRLKGAYYLVQIDFSHA